MRRRLILDYDSDGVCIQVTGEVYDESEKRLSCVVSGQLWVPRSGDDLVMMGLALCEPFPSHQERFHVDS
jgi:hypothetical protein